jgi:hypothetical protein
MNAPRSKKDGWSDLFLGDRRARRIILVLIGCATFFMIRANNTYASRTQLPSKADMGMHTAPIVLR